MWHIRILRSQLLVFGSWHNGVHEEATAITQLGRIGQLGSPDVDDGITNMLRRQRFCSNLLLREKMLAQITIVETRHKSAREAIGDVSDDISVLPILLEAALPISVTAVLVVEGHTLAGGNLYGFHTLDEVLRLNAIGTDVLHGTRTYLARNEREVLGSIPSAGNAVGHEVVPDNTATHTQQHALALRTLDGRDILDAHDG